ncbi:helix-turn-helix domain-containing protein [Anaerobium acetethylicum]|uniref:DNA binding domain-containing protein, excisionase family n=1 Tax=Anaerobium acetethylicum TaxID=1619234 RepID=A0A1D3TYI7_9FIRM|nr:helix-turn-helix domain-containing protein [Anaerobium acetethylicum]SCP99540.1 DNA binding domain-containing protein, excisionase family [Anaerobium acetethylicum]
MTKMITVKDVKEILGIGINQAYELVNSSAFPSIRCGRRILIPEDAFSEWIRAYTYGSYEK